MKFHLVVRHDAIRAVFVQVSRDLRKDTARLAEGLERGFRPWEKTALALLWFMPLIARTLAEQALIPLGVPAMGFALVLVLRRAAYDTGSFQHWHPAAHSIK